MKDLDTSWYVVFVGDPRRMAYIDNAFKSLHSAYTVWIPSQVRWERDKKTNQMVEKLKPLFQGYAFVRFNYENNRKINDQLRFHCGGYILRRPSVPEPYRLTNEEVSNIKDLEKSKTSTKSVANQYDIKIGDRVDIKTGPFQGLKGEVLNIKRDKIIVTMQVFGRAVATDVDPGCCERIYTL